MLLLAAAAMPPAGCIFPFGNDEAPLIRKPSELNPEVDAFSGKSVRTYDWSESLRRSDRNDSVLWEGSLRLSHTGDTVVDGLARPVFKLFRISGATPVPYSANGPAPAAVLTRLGFRPDQVGFDGAGIPDPGPSLPFPATPVLGWRLDTAQGDLHFVRVLDRVETVKLSGKRHESWAFAESTFWGGELLGTGTTWMGRTGLVRHRSEWGAFLPSAAGAGVVFREITAP
jgi:hypothetical protein